MPLPHFHKIPDLLARRHPSLPGNVKAKESAPASAASSASAASAASAAAQANPLDVPLVVSGGQNQTIREIVRGTYFRSGSNHGKPVYKKKREVIEDDDDDLDVLIYFWDERDGDENCGWWFSPSIGGDMVWAYHPSRKAWFRWKEGLRFVLVSLGCRRLRSEGVPTVLYYESCTNGFCVGHTLKKCNCLFVQCTAC